VNAYEVKAGIGVIAGNICVIHACALCVYYKNEYINTLTCTFLYLFNSVLFVARIYARARINTEGLLYDAERRVCLTHAASKLMTV